MSSAFIANLYILQNLGRHTTVRALLPRYQKCVLAETGLVPIRLTRLIPAVGHIAKLDKMLREPRTGIPSIYYCGAAVLGSSPNSDGGHSNFTNVKHTHKPSSVPSNLS